MTKVRGFKWGGGEGVVKGKKSVFFTGPRPQAEVIDETHGLTCTRHTTRHPPYDTIPHHTTPPDTAPRHRVAEDENNHSLRHVPQTRRHREVGATKCPLHTHYTIQRSTQGTIRTWSGGTPILRSAS